MTGPTLIPLVFYKQEEPYSRAFTNPVHRRVYKDL